jgi:hypothetical protein
MGIRRATASLTLLAFLGACTGWNNLPNTQPVPIPNGPHSLRLITRTGSMVELGNARLVGDSVIGEVRSGSYRTQVAVALQDIQKGQVYRVSAGGTGVLLGVLAIGLIAASTADYGFATSCILFCGNP